MSSSCNGRTARTSRLAGLLAPLGLIAAGLAAAGDLDTIELDTVEPGTIEPGAREPLPLIQSWLLLDAPPENGDQALPEPDGTLRLLGATIAPGSTRRLSWSSADLFEGLSTTTPVLVVNGVRPGPTLCLTAAVHGDELNGI
jgi:hypothetical protein